jgi:hypothetical protein
VPSWQAQLNSGAVEYWAHDTRVLAGAYYQYRVRLALLNPMLGRNRELSSEADAKTIALLTPWSDWSAKTLAPRSTLIFLVGSDGTNVRLEVFTKKWGQMTRKEFMVRRGEAIGQDNVEKELQPLEGGDFKKVKVDFRTGAVAVDFDFEKKIIKNGIPLVTTEMIYLEPDGRLSSRIYDIDQSSQILKDMRALVVEPATVRPVTPPPRPTTRATPPPPSPRPPGPPGPVRPF